MKTKRIFVIMLVISIMLTSFVGVSAASVEGLKLIINGITITDGLTAVGEVGSYHILAPADALSGELGAVCEWDGADTITVTKDGTTVVFTVGRATADVNGEAEIADATTVIFNEIPYISAEFCGRAFGYHVLSEKGGKRVRIVSKTGTTAPALTEKDGMAELVSTVHRPVPTKFSKSNRLDDLIFSKRDYTGVVKTTEDTKNSTMPDGEVIFSYEDFVATADKNHDGTEDWFDEVLITEEVKAGSDTGSISMKLFVEGVEVGVGRNKDAAPIDKALRIQVLEEMATVSDKQIHFAKKLPSPTAADKYALTFYARLIEGGDPDLGTGKVEVRVQKPVTYQQSLARQIEFGKKWTRFDFLLTGVEGATNVVFLPAHHIQTIEIGGFEIRDIGKDADTSYFNEKKVDLLAAELAPDAPWRAEALDRIAEVRKGDFTVVVKDKNGNPVPNANVEFDMFEHEFKFGIALDMEFVSDDKLEGYIVSNNGSREQEFIERVGPNFNASTQANRLKWDVYATDAKNNPGKKSTARIVMDEGIAQGLKYHRGHALWMPVNTMHTAEPQEMYDLLENDDRSLNARYADLLGFIEEHFEKMDEEFPELYEWDVTNETHVRAPFTNKFGERIFDDVYRIAAEKLTHGQRLILTDNAQFTQPYWERLDNFRDRGIYYDGFGMQGHSAIGSRDIANNYRPLKWLEVWDRFAYEYQKTFQVTEFSVGALKDEYGHKGQGDYMRDIMIAAFSHPACTGFNIWWLSDCWTDWASPYNPVNPVNKGNGAGVSPLYDRYFAAKPGLITFRDLVYNKWWTKDAKATTDSNGRGTVSGFYGDYDITVTVNGEVVKTEMAAFHKGYDNELVITLP